MILSGKKKQKRHGVKRLIFYRFPRRVCPFRKLLTAAILFAKGCAERHATTSVARSECNAFILRFSRVGV